MAAKENARSTSLLENVHSTSPLWRRHAVPNGMADQRSDTREDGTNVPPPLYSFSKDTLRKDEKSDGFLYECFHIVFISLDGVGEGLKMDKRVRGRVVGEG